MDAENPGPCSGVFVDSAVDVSTHHKRVRHRYARVTYLAVKDEPHAPACAFTEWLDSLR